MYCPMAQALLQASLFLVPVCQLSILYVLQAEFLRIIHIFDIQLGHTLDDMEVEQQKRNCMVRPLLQWFVLQVVTGANSDYPTRNPC